MDWTAGGTFKWRGRLPSRRGKHNRETEKMVEDNVPYQQRIFGEGYNLRPNFIQPHMSSQGADRRHHHSSTPTMWGHSIPLLCNNVIVKDIKIESLAPTMTVVIRNAPKTY